VTVQTERLELRPLSRDDADSWAALLADERVVRSLHLPKPHSREQAVDLLERTIERARGDVAMYTVHLRDGGAVAGFVGFAPRQLEWGDEVELGWSIFPDHQQRGIATEAARALRELVPGRLIALIRVENEASQNVARKIGMHHERDTEHVGFPTRVYVSSR
jgi:ribosomal-protein-alanine N-acetyltransferase